MVRKIFISHCYEDRRYSEIFVNLFKEFGFKDADIFYTSNSKTGINTGELIFDRLKDELVDSPIVLYFLSDNYYRSVACLNEMGASWITTNEHYPIALPYFKPSEIKGAIGTDRLALLLNKEITEIQLCDFINMIRKKASVPLPDILKYREIECIKPSYDKLQQTIKMEDYLTPNEDGYFETTLYEERVVLGDKQGDFSCFKLEKPIAADFLDLQNVSNTESHWLFFKKKWGNYTEGNKVCFKLNEEKPYYGKKYFNDIGKCKNIYVSYLEKID